MKDTRKISVIYFIISMILFPIASALQVYPVIYTQVQNAVAAIIGSVIITPLLFLRTLVELPICVVQDIWEDSNFERLEI